MDKFFSCYIVLLFLIKIVKFCTGISMNHKAVEGLQKGDISALENLFDYYYPRLYSFSKTFLKCEDGIDDILQEVFLKIWQNRKDIKSTQTFNSYIFTITKNLLLNELRSRLNNEKIRNEMLKNAVPEEYLLTDKVEFNELKEKVDEIVNQLPPRQQKVYQLSRAEGLSYKEIAEKLNISTKTVEYHIGQSLRCLKQKLKELGLFSLLYFYLFL